MRAPHVGVDRSRIASVALRCRRELVLQLNTSLLAVRVHVGGCCRHTGSSPSHEGVTGNCRCGDLRFGWTSKFLMLDGASLWAHWPFIVSVSLRIGIAV